MGSGTRGTVWSILIAAAITSGVSAQTPQIAPAQAEGLPAYRARLIGVYDAASGNPLQGVRILDLGTGFSSLTTSTGTLSLVYLPDGGGLVRLQKIGYQPITTRIAISPRDTTPLTVVMERVTELPKVVTTGTSPSKYLSPALRGFEERQRSHVSGVFIGDSILRRDESRMLADLLRTHASVPIKEGQGGATYLLRSPRCANGGPPQVYLDGVPLGPRPDPSAPKATRVGAFNSGAPAEQPLQAFDLSAFSLTDLAGVEYYPDNAVMPAEFAHTSQRCGALLLWTRER